MDANKLKSILSGARAVMDAVDNGKYQKGNIDPNALNGSYDSVNESNYNNSYESQIPQVPQTENRSMGYRNIHTTKMPKEIVQAMLENPIPTPASPYHTFELTQDFLSEVNPEVVTKKRTTNGPQRLAETKRSSMVGLTEDDVRKIVRDEMQEIIYEYFDQRVIKEDIQIKVGSTIFSGKLSPLPSKKSAKRK